MTLEQDGFLFEVTCVPPSSIENQATSGNVCDSCGAPLDGACDPDAALLCRYAQHGDLIALDEFFARYEQVVRRLVWSSSGPGTPPEVIDDIRQEACIKAIRN